MKIRKILIILISSIYLYLIFLFVVFQKPFLFTLFNVIAVLFLYSNFLKKKMKKKLNNYQKMKEKLTSNKSYEYIRKFAKKYVDIDLRTIEGKESIGTFNDEDFNKLKELLHKKEIDINDNELRYLIEDETEKLIYQDLKKKILHNKSKNLKEYIKNFLEVYGENYYKYIDYFSKFLDEMNEIKQEKYELEKNIKEVEKELELEHFEKKLDFGESPSISINEIDSMSGYDFERFLKTLFGKMGYRVEHTKFSSDQGGDLVVSKFGDKTVIQAKRYTGNVSNKAVQEVVASIKHYKADKGMVITNSSFTNSAIQLAKSNKIELIDRNKLRGLVKKYY